MRSRVLGAVVLLIVGVIGGMVAGTFVFGDVWSYLYLPHHNHGDPVPWFLPLMAIPPLLVAALTVALCMAMVSPGVLLLLLPWRERRSAIESDGDDAQDLAWVGPERRVGADTVRDGGRHRADDVRLHDARWPVA